MRTRYTIALLLLVFTTTSYAQSKFAVTYSVAFPTGETSDYFGSASWRGVGIDYSYLIQDNIGIGFSTGWQVFSDDVGYVTETDGTETVSGFRYNYLNSVPVFATGTYFFKASGKVEPYAALGIGLVYNRLEQDIGLFTNENTAWQFGLRPEVGLDYEFSYGVGLRAAVRYQYVASGSDVPSLPFFSVNVGLVWKN
ncbi:acyloxyacyl hydrolase [Robiginitalea sp.]|uniref:acyloxyacyl hydrolase n=1 Tax=Robiginitalea sp. TaxID=1902411 RepID=UPI003C72FEA3